MGKLKMAAGDLNDVKKVQVMLEGVVDAYNARQEKEKKDSQARAMHTREVTSNSDITPESIAKALAAMSKRKPPGNNLPDPCEYCGVRHAGQGEDCHAKLLSEVSLTDIYLDFKAAHPSAVIGERSFRKLRPLELPRRIRSIHSSEICIGSIQVRSSEICSCVQVFKKTF